MGDVAGGRGIQTDEAEAAEDTWRAEVLGEEFIRAEAVLEREQSGVVVKQRWEVSEESGILRSLQRDDDEITRADIARVGGHRADLIRSEREITIDAADVPPVFFDLRGGFTAKEKMDLMAGLCEAGSVIAADSASADDGDFFRPISGWRHL
jgi:hypothetical protein